MSKCFLSAVAWACLLLFSACATIAKPPSPGISNPDSPFVERSFHLMGTLLEVRVEADSRAQALVASDAVYRAIADAEKRLSTWNPNSQLARLNRAPLGRATPVSPLLDRDLRTATKIARETDFAFSPWVGPLVKVWGLRTGGHFPSAIALKRARAAAGFHAFTFSDTQPNWTRVSPGAMAEEGAFGKGVGLDDAISAVAAIAKSQAIHQMILDFGGQISIFSPSMPSIKTRVGIAHPVLRERRLFEIETAPGSLSTSGNSEHGIVTPHGKIGHELDPRTGSPAAYYDGSVTVAAPTGIEADALSTAIFVMGPEQGIRWANLHGKKALWLTPGAHADTWVAHLSCPWDAAIVPISSSPSEAVDFPKIQVTRTCEPEKETVHAS